MEVKVRFNIRSLFLVVALVYLGVKNGADWWYYILVGASQETILLEREN